jgi:hypothetical protein
MDAPEGTGRQLGGNDAITTRIGAVALPLAVLVLVVAEYFHPAKQDSMDNPAVFVEYAHSGIWTADHLAEYFGFLLLLGGLVALYYSVSAKRGVGAGFAPFGLAAAITTASSFTVLQAVDGVALKRAGDAWASAPAPEKATALAAAEAVRRIEMAMNSFSFFLAGLTLFIFGVAIALGSVYPRWVGLVAATSGAAFMYDGAVVAYEGFVPSIVKLVGLALLAVWAFVMAVLMWRNGGRRRIARPGSTPRNRASNPSVHTRRPSTHSGEERRMIQAS